MWDSSNTHTHHTINQIGASQSPPLKSLTSLLGLTLWGNVSEPTQSYRVDSDTICNDLQKSTSHIYAICQNDQSRLRLLVIVNKAQIYSVNTQCGTHHTPTHITQSIKLEHPSSIYWVDLGFINNQSQTRALRVIIFYSNLIIIIIIL